MKPSFPRREPVITAGAIVSAVGALVNAVNAFGLAHIDQQQLDSINGLVIAMWPLLLIIRQAVWSPASVQAIEDEAYRNGLDDAR